MNEAPMATTTRVTLTLPNEIERKLRKRPNKSAFVASALRDRLERGETLRRSARLAAAYAAAAKEDAALRSDWDAALGDGL